MYASHLVDDEPTYILHRRPYQENSLLLDAFSLNHGRVPLIAKGLKGRRASWQAILQLFQPIQMGWKGRKALKTVSQATAPTPALKLHEERMYCGFYINELVLRLYPENDPNPILFASYVSALVGLAGGDPMDIVLRRFELSFLTALGLAPSFDVDFPDRQYCWHKDFGFIEANKHHDMAIPGDHLKAVADGYLEANPEDMANYLQEVGAADPIAYDRSIRRSCKLINRQLIDHALNGKTLRSRELMASLKKQQR